MILLSQVQATPPPIIYPNMTKIVIIKRKISISLFQALAHLIPQYTVRIHHRYRTIGHSVLTIALNIQDGGGWVGTTEWNARRML